MKNVLFNLGPTTGLASRTLVITRHSRAGDTLPVSAYHNADAGANAVVTVALPDNTIWQAVLTDVRTSGETAEPQILNFNTGSLQFPGPSNSSGNASQFSILAMEDLSSSSSSSNSSSSSSSKSVSTSSSSNSISTSSASSNSSSSSSRSSASMSTSSSSSSKSSGSSGLN